MNPSQERFETLERIRRADRLNTLEHVAAHVAHQLGTPLNVLEGRATILTNGASSAEDVQRNARIIAEQSARMVRMLRELVSFCRREPGRASLIDLATLARTAGLALEHLSGARQVEVRIEVPDHAIFARGNADALLLALTHVVENAIRFARSPGVVLIRVRAEERSDSDERARRRNSCVYVEDDGPGIDVEVLPRLFKPFTTTHGGRDASGVGLFVAHSILRDHGGCLEGTNGERGGALFCLRLPEEMSDAE